MIRKNKNEEVVPERRLKKGVFGGKNKKVEDAEPRAGRRASGRVGRNVDTKTVKTEKIESERQRVRRESGRRLWLSIMVVVIMAVVVAYLTYGAVKGVMQYLDEANSASVVVEEKVTASVTIVDETGSKIISERVKEYVGYMEADLKALGYEVDRAVLPEKYVREIDIYVKGRKEYYKAHLDRGTAVTAEDMVRMIKYLDEHEIDGAHYVDVRVAGKAFYK